MFEMDIAKAKEQEEMIASLLKKRSRETTIQEDESRKFDALAFSDPIGNADAISDTIDKFLKISGETGVYVDSDDFFAADRMLIERLIDIDFAGLLKAASEMRISGGMDKAWKWTAEKIGIFVEDTLVPVMSRRFRLFGDELFFVKRSLFLEKLGHASMMPRICTLTAAYFKEEFRIASGSTTMKRFEEALIRACSHQVDVKSTGIQFSDCILKPDGSVSKLSDGSYPRYTFHRDVADVLDSMSPRAAVHEVDDLLLHLSNGDADVKRCLIDRLSMAFVTSTHMKNALEAKMVILMGAKGENGKSTLAGLIERAFNGENFKAFSIKSFNGYFLADAPNALMMVNSEAAEVYLDADTTAALKQVVTADTLVVRQIYQKPKTITPFTQLVVLTNSPLKSEDKTSGWTRRLEWYDTLEKLERPQAWFDKINSNAAADYLFEMLLVNAVKLMRAGTRIEVPSKLVEAANDYDGQNRNAARWLAEVGDDAIIGKPIGMSYEMYEEWCEASSEPPLGKSKFLQLVQDSTGLLRKVKFVTMTNDPDEFEWMMGKSRDKDRLLRDGKVQVRCWAKAS